MNNIDRNKKVSIYQPVYFPWLGFFHKLVLSDTYVILDDCQAIKQSWMNRVMIKQGSEKRWITVPILTKNRSTQLVRDIEIDYRTDWVKKHLRTIQVNYSKAAYFDEIYTLVEKILFKKHRYLIDINMECINTFKDALSINVEMVSSSDLDYESVLSTQRLINIIKAVEGDTYICGLGSDDYLEPELFSNNNIDLKYQRYETYEYNQVGKGPFLEGLSIIDTYANVGIKGILELIQRNNELN